jgi:hypothetical protein
MGCQLCGVQVFSFVRLNNDLPGTVNEYDNRLEVNMNGNPLTAFGKKNAVTTKMPLLDSAGVSVST